jgi:hypothetical protein
MLHNIFHKQLFILSFSFHIMLMFFVHYGLNLNTHPSRIKVKISLIKRIYSVCIFYTFTLNVANSPQNINCKCLMTSSLLFHKSYHSELVIHTNACYMNKYGNYMILRKTALLCPTCNVTDTE